jgi:hypothetical protein
VPKICAGEKTSSSINGSRKTGFPSVEHLNLIPVSHFVKASIKWIKNLNVISEIVKLIQEKIGNTLDHIGISANFMNGTLIAH